MRAKLINVAGEGDPDLALLADVARGDRAAFSRLYRRYHAPLAAFASKVTRRTELADDIVNEAMLVVWRSAARFEGRSRPGTWIFGIAYKCALNAMRTARRRREDASVELDDAADELSVPSGVDAIIDRDTVARALTVLSPEQRAVIELTYFFGYSVTEVGDIVGCPAGTVKTRMFSARQKMHAALQGEAHG